jgi:hypothetical protein
MTEKKNILLSEIVRRSEEKEELIKKISALDLENTKLRAMLAKNKLERCDIYDAHNEDKAEIKRYRYSCPKCSCHVATITERTEFKTRTSPIAEDEDFEMSIETDLVERTEEYFCYRCGFLYTMPKRIS